MTVRVDNDNSVIYKYNGVYPNGTWIAEKISQVYYIDPTTSNGLDYVINTDPLFTSLSRDLIFLTKFSITNSGVFSLNINGIGSKMVKKVGAFGLENLHSNEILVGVLYSISYNGTDFQLTNAFPNSYNIQFFIPAGETITVKTNEQYWVYGDLTIEGTLNNYGQVVIANGDAVLQGGALNLLGSPQGELILVDLSNSGSNSNSGSASNTFNNDIVASLSNNKTLGKYQNGQTISCIGKTFEQVLNDIAIETQYPTLIAPTFLVSLGDSTTKEVGLTFSTTLTGTFNRGQILGNLVSNIWNPATQQNFRAGLANLYTLDGNSFGVNSTTVTVTRSLVPGTNTFTASVSFDAGSQPLDSTGLSYSTALLAGSLSNSTSITARYKIFHGTSSIPITNSAEVRSLVSSVFDTTTIFSININALKYVIAMPSIKTLSSVITSNNETITVNFSLTTFSVNDAGGSAVSYKIYTLENATVLNLNATVTIS